MESRKSSQPLQRKGPETSQAECRRFESDHPLQHPSINRRMTRRSSRAGVDVGSSSVGSIVPNYPTSDRDDLGTLLPCNAPTTSVWHARCERETG